MKFIIKDRNIESLQIIIESPFELRALYILMKFVEQPAFQTVICTASDFDSIPGLGTYCKTYTRENPIKLLYNMLANKGNYSHSLSQKLAIVDACKSAILLFNKLYQEYFKSNFFTKLSGKRYALRLFGEIANSGDKFTAEEFNHSIYARRKQRDSIA